MSNSKTPSTQPAVKIDRMLFDSITDWLKTDYAKSLGFHSKAHFMTQAGRDLLFKYRMNVYSNVIRFHTHYELYDDLIKKKIEISINNSENSLECLNCNSFSCDHIFHIWKDQQELSYLEKLNFLNPIIALFPRQYKLK